MKDFSIDTPDEKLAVVMVGEGKPSALFLHGAGKATKERAIPIAEKLETLGISSVLFDFSGHGSSTGELLESSLTKRVTEAKVVADHFDFIPEILVAFSMGGHIALELLKDWPIKVLLLFYPAVYADEAVQVPFGEGFSDIIRAPESWRSASVINNLETFKGRLLIVIGEHDAVIPREVIELIESKAVNASETVVKTIPNAGHLLLEKVFGDELLKDEIFGLIEDFIKE